MATTPPRLDGSSLDAARWLTAADELGAAVGEPVVLVELDADAPPVWSPGSHPVVVVGVRAPGWTGPAEPDEVCDVVVAADDPWLDVVLANVRQHPLTSTALAVHLRRTLLTTVDEGLAAESAVYSLLQAGPEFAAWLQSRAMPTVAPDVEPPVLVTRDGDLLTITLNRPRRHNAVNERLRAALADALTVAVLDAALTVDLRGAGPSFSSGGDLAEFGLFSDPATAHVSRLTRSPGRLISQLGDRITVHLHGACMGAGIEMAAFAGRVVADEAAAISLPEIGIGLIPGAGGTVSLPRRIGRHRTALLALSGERISATTAARLGPRR